jgi:hypothetical protein
VRIWPDGNRVTVLKFVNGSGNATVYLNSSASEDAYGKVESTTIAGDVGITIGVSNGSFTINNTYELPAISPFLPNCDLNAVQNDAITIGPDESSLSSSESSDINGRTYRYRCIDEHWDSDIYFEVFSYGYSNLSEGTVSYVEFMIYAIKK